MPVTALKRLYFLTTSTFNVKIVIFCNNSSTFRDCGNGSSLSPKHTSFTLSKCIDSIPAPEIAPHSVAVAALPHAVQILTDLPEVAVIFTCKDQTVHVAVTDQATRQALNELV